ncbi:ATP-binding protein [Pseudodesulfovibrio portus]|uniref:histidine kinase n=1 Tax=Pseudodesulfovibrio portus TaxID=231439 RepID=A0ABM8AU97_9BACT|nr:ATP-binding protein [Pseudodesulfovibrio portus]BDQ35072.1 hypothetical protein JCM14722_26140 [Pseudodesulfovibrio portus]
MKDKQRQTKTGPRADGTAPCPNENEYRALFENTGTAMATVDEDSVILRCNTQFSKLAACPIEDIAGKMKWSDFVDAEDLRRMKTYFRQRTQAGGQPPDNYTFTFLACDNVRKTVHVFVRLNPESGERICSLIDVTDREETLEALRKSEERYALVAKGANDGFWDWDLTTNAVWYSQRYKAILGYSDEEFPNLPESWINAIHPDDYGRALDANSQCLEGKVDQFEVEYRMLHKDGSVRWILGRGASVRDKDGKVHRMAGTHTDITARKFNERTTNALYAISSAISTTRDPRELYEHIHRIIDEAIDADNFFITLLNEETDSLEFVYFSDEKDDYYTIPDVSDPSRNSLSIHVFRTGVPLLLSAASPRDMQHMEQIGIIGTLPASWLGVPLRLRGVIMGAMAVQDYQNPRQYSEADVTFMTAVSEQVALAIERKLNEEELELKVDMRTRELRKKAAELEEANARLLELGQVKSSLVSSVSHELRTPLTSIRGFAKLCSKDFLRYFGILADSPKLKNKADRIRNNLEIIDMEGERLTRLINDFLDISRIESGKASWHDRLIDPCEIIRQAVSAASGSFAANPEIRLEINLPDTCKPIHADPDKIQQVVINLLNNAYKFTRKGSVTISLTEARGAMTASILDTGSGVPPADLPHLFEKFHKSVCGDTVTDENKGTGLGLAICKEIVEHYGGNIWVESTEGHGSCFSFSLPTIWS